MRGCAVAVLAVFVTAGLCASDIPKVSVNDNRVPAGKLQDGVLTLELEIVEGRWFPEADDGPSVVVYAFAEPGQPPRVPGPMLRVPQGTEVALRLTNRVADTSRIYGLQPRPSAAAQPFDLAPGATRELRFRLGAPGTFHYWASTSGKPMVERAELDSTLSGAVIVDPPGARLDDRVLMVGTWYEPGTHKAGPRMQERALTVINGKSWPHTERLHYKLGEEVHWRVINVSWGPHPMHLHGTYFRVDSLGDGASDTIYSQAQQRMAVTENIPEGGTYRMTWWPDREGRWVFHCHILGHISRAMALDPPQEDSHADHTGAGSGMRGLVMGIEISRDGPAGKLTNASAREPRQLHLVATRREGPSGSSPTSAGYQLAEGPAEPAAPPAIPGPAIILRRREPVAITVENRLAEPTAVHWHGIELESYYDGVPGWGGIGAQVTPSIEPGGKFVARFTPPRAGTFIYHTHWHEIGQLTTGLYGPIVVLNEDEKYDPDADRLYLASRGGPDNDKDPFLLNGSAAPLPQTMKLGKRYRMRFINITAHNTLLRFELLAGGRRMEWRGLAKDGWTMPAHQQTLRPSRQLIGVGETYDFLFQPDAPGKLELVLMRAKERLVVLPITVTR